MIHMLRCNSPALSASAHVWARYTAASMHAAARGGWWIFASGRLLFREEMKIGRVARVTAK